MIIERQLYTAVAHLAHIVIVVGEGKGHRRGHRHQNVAGGFIIIVEDDIQTIEEGQVETGTPCSGRLPFQFLVHGFRRGCSGADDTSERIHLIQGERAHRGIVACNVLIAKLSP